MGAFFGAKLAAQARLHARQVKAMELLAAHVLPVPERSNRRWRWPERPARSQRSAPLRQSLGEVECGRG
jgi:hypothetical protein